MKRRLLTVLSALAAVGVTAACGSSSGSASIAGPSEPTVAVPGATVRGTVQTGAVAAAPLAGVRAAVGGGGLRVTVVGTTLGTVTDSNGGFVLENVPAGRAELRFEGAEVDARLEIEGLVAGQTLSISVHLSGRDAVLAGTDDGRHEASLRGAIESIAGTTLRVAGRSVRTDGMTAFLGRRNEPIGLGAFRVGDFVEVEGTGQSDGSLYARKVKLEDGPGDDNGGGNGEDPGAEVNFRGSIGSLSPFRVAGRLVVVDGHTRILDRRNDPIPFSALRAGETVEVEGWTLGDASVLAKKVKQED